MGQDAATCGVTHNQTIEVQCFVNHYAGHTSYEAIELGYPPKLSSSPPHLGLPFADHCAAAVARATGGMVQRVAVEEVWLEPGDPTIMRDMRFR